ncbi:MAG: hypothetical protein AAFR65_03090 [Pseudomonadota bacterium]
MRTAIVSAVGIAIAALGSAHAGGKLGLNHVWSRIADINGEYGSVESSEFSPDGMHVVTGSKFDNTVRVFRVDDGHMLWRREVPQEIERVAWTRDGQYVASVSEDGYLRVFDVDTAEVIFDFEHENGIDGLSVSHDGRYLATGREKVDGRGVVRVFATDDWRLVKELPHAGTVNELDFSSDDGYLAAVGDFEARIWSVDEWRVEKKWNLPERSPTFDGEKHIFINTRFSPDDEVLAVGGTHGFVYLYDVDSGDLIRRLNKSGQKTETVEWTKDGRFLLVAGHGYTIDFFSVDVLMDSEVGNDAIPFAHQAEVSDALEYMDFNATGTMLTTAHQDGTVQLWTFMSDNPNINEAQHRKVRKLQDELAAKANKKTQ